LRNHVGKVIGAIAKPDDLHFAPGLPKTRSGKIMRRLFKELVVTGTISPATSPRSRISPSSRPVACPRSHLLREAETYLGMSLWEHVESDRLRLSVEYWNLRKLIKEREEVDRKVAACKQRLDQAHEERAALLNGVT
jgi:hypothetical protein